MTDFETVLQKKILNDHVAEVLKKKEISPKMIKTHLKLVGLNKNREERKILNDYQGKVRLHKQIDEKTFQNKHLRPIQQTFVKTWHQLHENFGLSKGHLDNNWIQNSPKKDQQRLQSREKGSTCEERRKSEKDQFIAERIAAEINDNVEFLTNRINADGLSKKIVHNPNRYRKELMEFLGFNDEDVFGICENDIKNENEKNLPSLIENNQYIINICPSPRRKHPQEVIEKSNLDKYVTPKNIKDPTKWMINCILSNRNIFGKKANLDKIDTENEINNQNIGRKLSETDKPDQNYENQQKPRKVSKFASQNLNEIGSETSKATTVFNPKRHSANPILKPVQAFNILKKHNDLNTNEEILLDNNVPLSPEIVERASIYSQLDKIKKELKKEKRYNNNNEKFVRSDSSPKISNQQKSKREKVFQTEVKGVFKLRPRTNSMTCFSSKLSIREANRMKSREGINMVLKKFSLNQNELNNNLKLISSSQNEIRNKFKDLKGFLKTDDDKRLLELKKYMQSMFKMKHTFLYGNKNGHYVSDKGEDVVKVVERMARINPKFKFLIKKACEKLQVYTELI